MSVALFSLHKFYKFLKGIAREQITYEYLRLSATSESLPSAYSEDNPNSLESALKLTSNLLGVLTEEDNSQDD